MLNERQVHGKKVHMGLFEHEWPFAFHGLLFTLIANPMER
jgi:hypothetical protein